MGNTAEAMSYASDLMSELRVRAQMSQRVKNIDSFDFIGEYAGKMGVKSALCLVQKASDEFGLELHKQEIAKLSGRPTEEAERRAAHMTFLRGEGETYRAIGDKYGVSIERARQIIRKLERKKARLMYQGSI